MDETDLRDIAAGDVRATAADAQELAKEVLRLRQEATPHKSVANSPNDSERNER